MSLAVIKSEFDLVDNTGKLEKKRFLSSKFRQFMHIILTYRPHAYMQKLDVEFFFIAIELVMCQRNSWTVKKLYFHVHIFEYNLCEFV